MRELSVRSCASVYLKRIFAAFHCEQKPATLTSVFSFKDSGELRQINLRNSFLDNNFTQDWIKRKL